MWDKITKLQNNTASHWPGANLESSLNTLFSKQYIMNSTSHDICQLYDCPGTSKIIYWTMHVKQTKPNKIRQSVNYLHNVWLEWWFFIIHAIIAGVIFLQLLLDYVELWGVISSGSCILNLFDTKQNILCNTTTGRYENIYLSLDEFKLKIYCIVIHFKCRHMLRQGWMMFIEFTEPFVFAIKSRLHQRTVPHWLIALHPRDLNRGLTLQYIPRNMHTVLLCFALLWLCNRS